MPDFSFGNFLGFSDQSVLTFLFTLAVIFGVLELTNLFKNRAVNLIISLALSAAASSQPAFVNVLYSYLPGITGFFIVVFFIAFGFEIVGARKKKTSPTESMAVGAGVLLILFAIGSSIIKLVPMDIPLIGSQGLLFLIGLVLIIGLFWKAMVMGEEGKGGKE